jgi:hypothetical protein
VRHHHVHLGNLLYGWLVQWVGVRVSWYRGACVSASNQHREVEQRSGISKAASDRCSWEEASHRSHTAVTSKPPTILHQSAFLRPQMHHTEARETRL